MMMKVKKKPQLWFYSDFTEKIVRNTRNHIVNINMM